MPAKTCNQTLPTVLFSCFCQKNSQFEGLRCRIKRVIFLNQVLIFVWRRKLPDLPPPSPPPHEGVEGRDWVSNRPSPSPSPSPSIVVRRASHFSYYLRLSLIFPAEIVAWFLWPRKFRKADSLLSGLLPPSPLPLFVNIVSFRIDAPASCHLSCWFCQSRVWWFLPLKLSKHGCCSPSGLLSRRNFTVLYSASSRAEMKTWHKPRQ